MFIWLHLLTNELSDKTEPVIKLTKMVTNIHPQIPQKQGVQECHSEPGWAKVNDLEVKGHYQKVRDRNIFVYSAYYDNRTNQNIIRIMGISMEGEGDIYCQTVCDSRVWVSVKANLTRFSLMLPEMHQGYKYRPYFITCPGTTESTFIGLSPRSCERPRNVLKVQRTRSAAQENSIKPKILVCMKTIFDSLIPQRFIEFVEWQKLLKVDKIILYDIDNITTDMNRTILHFISEGILEIQKYLPPASKSDLRDRGQLIQVNDCLYRNMYKYQYITFLDPDEIIVPRLHEVKSYAQLIETMILLNSSAAGYRFPNVIFCLKPSETNQVPPDLLSIRKLVRSDFFPYGTWTKVIVNPRRILEMGIHRIEGALKGYHFPVFVPPSVGALHHYRSYDFRYCAYNDRTTIRFQKEMIKNYKKKILLLKLK